MTMTLTQEKINKLDKIGKKFGHELNMPPFKGQINPFFALKDSDTTDGIIKALAASKFTYALTKIGKGKYITIKG